MKLSKCKIGRLVCIKEFDGTHPNYNKPALYTQLPNTQAIRKMGVTPYLLVGHIVGLSLTGGGETTAIVKWNDGREQEVHPGNLLEVNNDL